MEIRIGIANSPKEISFETDAKAAQIKEIIAAAFDSNAATVNFKDNKNREYIVPVKAINYFEIGADETRKVGFVS